MSLAKIYKVVLGYAAASVVLAVCFDRVIDMYFQNGFGALLDVGTVKSLLFIIIASVVLFFVLKTYEEAEQKHRRRACEDEARSRLLVENMMDGVLLTSPDGIVYSANKAAQSIFGMTENEICQAGRALLVDQNDARLQAMQQIRKESGSVRGGLRFRRHSGEIFESEISSSIFHDVDGNCRTCVVIRDVANMRIVEDSLQKELIRRRIIMNISNDGIAVFDKDHRLVECNDKFADMLGYGTEEILGLYTWDIEAVFTKEQIRKSFENFSKICKRFESKHRRRDGSLYDVEVSASGVVIGSEPIVVTICRDISERKQSEHDIQESEERFRRLFDDVDSISVQGYDANRNVLYWNRASELLYGYSRSEALCSKLEDLIIPQDMKTGVVAAISAWVNDGQPIPAGELCLKRKDGSDVFVFSSHVLQENRFGNKELFCLDVDLSELHKTKQELVKSKELAEFANKTKSEFLANMSHEIRTPLNGILGMTQLLAMTRLDEEQQEYVEASIKSAQKLNVLLSDILDLSRVEANRLVVSKARFEFEMLVKSLRDVFGIAANDKGLSLSFEIDARIPQYLIGDEVRIRQILFNILGNAIKFTKIGKVQFSCFLGSETNTATTPVVFAISDTGVGMQDANLRYIFDQFTQVDGSFVREQQGVGLGLSIVKKLVRLLGGSICVDSDQASGTTFYVCLPLQFAPMSGQTEVPSPEFQNFVQDRALRILVVEDEKLNRIVVVTLLRKFGHDVVTAQDGREALRILSGKAFDLILMDVQMPIMDGVTATQTIRRSPEFITKANIPIIAMTAHAMSGDWENFLAAGMDDYVSKPFDQQTLLVAINRVMARQGPAGQ